MNKKAQSKLLAVTRGSKLGAIIRCALNIPFGIDNPMTPRFHGKAIMTSDDFIMCDFVDRDGEPHFGAFVGSRQDFNRNIAALAVHCDLAASDRAVFFEIMNDWCGVARSSRRA